jgi:hypothetical protein
MTTERTTNNQGIKTVKVSRSTELRFIFSVLMTQKSSPREVEAMVEDELSLFQRWVSERTGSPYPEVMDEDTLSLLRLRITPSEERDAIAHARKKY